MAGTALGFRVPPSVCMQAASSSTQSAKSSGGSQRLTFALELQEGMEAPSPNGLRRAVLDRLASINQDYREASRSSQPASSPS